MLSIIIPVKNEEQLIENSIDYLLNEIKNIKFEIIIIDDFSDDGTAEKVKKFVKNNDRVKFLRNINEGLGPLIDLGIEKSSGDYICIMMSDLSDDIQDLKVYYEKINNTDYDAILGSRFIKDSSVFDYPIIKLILNRIFNYVVKILFLSNYNDFTNAFKIYKKSSLIKLRPFVSTSFNIFLELPLKLISRGYRYEIIPIKWVNRKKGKSKFKIKELGAKYIFTLIYCLSEKILLKKQVK